MEIRTLRKQGWAIAKTARHTGRDRKTIRSYLAGQRQPGVRAAVESDPFDLIEPYVVPRLVDGHGEWGTILSDEVLEFVDECRVGDTGES